MHEKIGVLADLLQIERGKRGFEVHALLGLGIVVEVEAQPTDIDRFFGRAAVGIGRRCGAERNLHSIGFVNLEIGVEITLVGGVEFIVAQLSGAFAYVIPCSLVFLLCDQNIDEQVSYIGLVGMLFEKCPRVWLCFCSLTRRQHAVDADVLWQPGILPALGSDTCRGRCGRIEPALADEDVDQICRRQLC